MSGRNIKPSHLMAAGRSIDARSAMSVALAHRRAESEALALDVILSSVELAIGETRGWRAGGICRGRCRPNQNTPFPANIEPDVDVPPTFDPFRHSVHLTGGTDDHEIAAVEPRDPGVVQRHVCQTINGSPPHGSAQAGRDSTCGYSRILRSAVKRGHSHTRAVATMSWFAGSRWKAPGSTVDSTATRGVRSRNRQPG